MLDTELFGLELNREYPTAYLIGRGVSATCDLISILLVFLVGWRLYGRAIGLLSSALYAGAVLPIQQSHFFTVDSCANLFVVAAFWLALIAIETASWFVDVLFGLCVGLGVASKISVVPVAFLMLPAIVLRVGTQVGAYATGLRDWMRRSVWQEPGPRAALIRGALSLNVVVLVSLLTFRIAQPYAFLPAHGEEPPPLQADTVARVIDNLLDVVAPRLNPAWLNQMSEVGRSMSGDTDQPPNHQWAKRTILVFPWVNMVRFGIGWPLGLTAWVAWACGLYQIVRRSRGWTRHVLPVAWIGIFFVWQGTQWVKSMRYLLPVYPLLVVMAAWGLMTWAQRARATRISRGLRPWRGSGLLSVLLIVFILVATYGWAFAFTRIYTRPHTRIAASEWIYQHVSSAITLTLDTPDGGYVHQIGLPQNWKPADASVDDPVTPPVSSSLQQHGQDHAFPFTLGRTGTLTALTFTHVLDPSGDATNKVLRVGIGTNSSRDSLLTERILSADFLADGTRGHTYQVDLGPLELEAGRTFYIIVSPASASLVVSGSTIATEGNWDDALPLPMAGYDPWAVQYQGYPLEMVWEDTPQKRARLQYILEHADYIVISSNRFYSSLSRNPKRWPMTIDYYRALFSGDLGFELAGDFTSYPGLGPFEFNDQSAEEAFTVYDHPRVLVYRKTAAFNAAVAARVLGRANLDEVVRSRADRVVESPVALVPPPMGRR